MGAHHRVPARAAGCLRPPTTPDAVKHAAAGCSTLDELDVAVTTCRACPRLVEWRERVALEKRRAFANDDYWGRPVPGFGDSNASILIVGLAPAAHGANRTGRMFTGDRSGDWLYAALHRAGLANQPTAISADDGLELRGVRVTASVRCAPPANQPTPVERATCSAWLDADLCLTPARAIVALGAVAWTASLTAIGRTGDVVPRPRPRFGHCAEATVGEWTVIGSYHPSQQNTFTGKLTEPMLDAVFTRARAVAGLSA